MKKLTIAAIIFALSLILIPVVSAETCIYDFGLDGCPHCAKVKAFLDDMEKEYDLDIRYIDANEESELFASLLKQYNVSVNDWGKVPAVFIGDYACVGDTTCITNLEDKIIEFDGFPCPGGEEPQSTNNNMMDITIAGISGLAIVDAINPCALAVLIILLSTILLRDPKHEKKALFSGLAFSLAVYLCYFGMGLLLVLGLKWVAGVSSLSTAWLYKGFGVFAIILGILNIKDYVKYGAGGFVMEVPMKWRPAMKHFIQNVTSIKGAFIVGIIVSIFLLPCTSGPYFVAGGLLAGVDWMSALPWLILYNAIFVAPMVAITLFIYGGFMAVDEISGWRERNIRRLHLVAGIILVVLGLAMVLGFV